MLNSVLNLSDLRNIRNILTKSLEYIFINLRNVTKFDEESYATTFPIRSASYIVVTRKILFTHIFADGGDGVGSGLLSRLTTLLILFWGLS